MSGNDEYTGVVKPSIKKKNVSDDERIIARRVEGLYVREQLIEIFSKYKHSLKVDNIIVKKSFVYRGVWSYSVYIKRGFLRKTLVFRCEKGDVEIFKSGDWVEKLPEILVEATLRHDEKLNKIRRRAREKMDKERRKTMLDLGLLDE